MKLTKNVPVVPIINSNSIIVPTDIEIIEPIATEINEGEIQHLQEKFLQMQEKNEYYHLAYSRY